MTLDICMREFVVHATRGYFVAKAVTQSIGHTSETHIERGQQHRVVQLRKLGLSQERSNKCWRDHAVVDRCVSAAHELTSCRRRGANDDCVLVPSVRIPWRDGATCKESEGCIAGNKHTRLECVRNEWSDCRLARARRPGDHNQFRQSK